MATEESDIDINCDRIDKGNCKGRVLEIQNRYAHSGHRDVILEKKCGESQTPY